MRLYPLLLLVIFAVALLLSACATAPQLGAGAKVATDPCGQPVVTATVSGAPAGGGWQADTAITAYKPCSTPLSSPASSQEPANDSTQTQEP